MEEAARLARWCKTGLLRRCRCLRGTGSSELARRLIYGGPEVSWAEMVCPGASMAPTKWDRTKRLKYEWPLRRGADGAMPHGRDVIGAGSQKMRKIIAGWIMAVAY